MGKGGNGGYHRSKVRFHIHDGRREEVRLRPGRDKGAAGARLEEEPPLEPARHMTLAVGLGWDHDTLAGVQRDIAIADLPVPLWELELVLVNGGAVEVGEGVGRGT